MAGVDSKRFKALIQIDSKEERHQKATFHCEQDGVPQYSSEFQQRVSHEPATDLDYRPKYSQSKRWTNTVKAT
jgi:hypothetical protein